MHTLRLFGVLAGSRVHSTLLDTLTKANSAESAKHLNHPKH